MNILEHIIANKKKEIERHQEAFSIERLLETEQINRHTISMRKTLQESETGIIAEFKRKSPSKGWIHPNAQIKDTIPAYEKAGASASSILTDEMFFGGTPGDLCQARKMVNMPLLRKEFIIDEYQIYQAKAMGADAILLIAAAISTQECNRFVQLAHKLGLEVLLELHDEAELCYIENSDTDMVGINNRDLTSFETDINRSFEMIKKLPPQKLCISESGISDPKTVKELKAVGFRGFLMGENFMKHELPGCALSAFIKQLKI